MRAHFGAPLATAVGALLALILATRSFGHLHASPIVGGSPIGCSPFDFPYMVSLQMQPAANAPFDPHAERLRNATRTATGLNHFCGGVYVADDWLATAAHCVGHLNATLNSVYAVIGATNLCSPFGKSVRTYRVLEIRSKRFDPYTYADDIAMLRIDTRGHGRPIDVPERLVALPQPDDDAPNAPDAASDGGGLPGRPAAQPTDVAADDRRRFDRCYLIGYGSTRINGAPTLKLRIGPNARIDAGECARKLGRFMAPQPGTAMFCAEGLAADGRPVDACQGDSGGPLLCRRRSDRRFEVIGLTSYGAGCGVPNTPGVYTSVAGHVQWMRSIVAGERIKS